MKPFIFTYLPAVIFALQDITCPEPWPTPATRSVMESCSCETEPSYGLRVKCSWVNTWPSSTPLDTMELLLDGTRLNTTLLTYSLAGFAPRLHVYSCNDCGITDIEKFAFFGLNSLKTLSLEDNDMRTLRPFTFTGLKNLRVLNLKNCGIFTIERNAFYSLANVDFFDLSKNYLYTIEVNAFKNVSLISQLSFNQIKAERLKSYTLKGLRDINLLSFTHSEIRKLEAYSFFGVENITTISFHSSQLRDVMPFAFVGLGKVNSIKFKSTEISTLSCEALEGLDCVKAIDWTLSPLRCDCNIQWMVELSANISRDVTKGIACASPYQFKDKNPLDLEKDELGCNDEERFMGCAPLDTRVPRVKALERYIEDVRRPNSSATSNFYNLAILTFSLANILLFQYD